jgi:olfactory receptor
MNPEEINVEDNVSTVKQFVLLGFSDIPNLQGLLSGVFSIIYIIILVGNSFLIIITKIDPSLQKPMYF